MGYKFNPFTGTIDEIGTVSAAGSGSAGAPGIAFASDPNTGIFNPAADTLAVATAGSERLRITSAGNVGIGTSSPQALLDVTGGPVLTKNIVFTTSQNAAYLIAGTTSYTGATTNFGTYGFQHRFKVDGSGIPRITVDGYSGEFFCINDTGRVGIGTSSPGELLHVAGNARVGAATGDVNLEVGTGASANRNALIDLVGDTTYTDYGLRIIRTNGGANADSKMQHRGTGALIIEAQEAAPTIFFNGGSERARITSAGLVGIGTSSPSSLLHLADAGNITVGTTTGTKIGTATTQKLGFYNATPVVQPTAVADATTAVDVITQLNDLLAKLRTLGIIAT